jgi:translocator protein
MSELASSSQLRAAFLRWALFLVPGIVLLGFLSGAVGGSGPGDPWFDSLVKPGIYPPPATFGTVWTVLYVMMGLALATVVTARGARRRGFAIAAFAIQLLLNLTWSPLFFGAHEMSGALLLLVVLDVAVMITIVAFYRVRPRAAFLLAPYLAWILFATLLNWQFLELNPDADGRQNSGAAVRVAI